MFSPASLSWLSNQGALATTAATATKTTKNWSNRFNSSKTTTLHVHRTFLYISLPSLHDCYVKLPIFAFYGGRKQATTNFISFSKFECGPQEINSREIRLQWTFSAKRNKRDKVWKKREFILKITFSLPSPLSIGKLPAPYDTESAGVDWKGTPGACSRVLCVIPKTP